MIDVSVIIPMYNSERTILNSINSVLNQSYSGKIEIIVIDDGSTDNSYFKVNALVQNNDKIKIYQKTNGGVSSARNLGIKNACGNYIAFLDSDDQWYPEKLEVQVNILENDKSISLIGCNINDKVLQRFLFKKFHYITEITVKDLIYKNFFQPSTVIVRRNIIDKIGFFDESQRYAEEGNFFMRISAGYKCVLLNKQLIVFGQSSLGYTGSGLSSNLVEMEKGEIKNLKFALKNKYISFFSFLFAYTFSCIKFLRRLVIVKLHKII